MTMFTDTLQRDENVYFLISSELANYELFHSHFAPQMFHTVPAIYDK